MLLKSQDLWKNVICKNIDEYYSMMRRAMGEVVKEKEEDDKKSMIEIKERLKWERDDEKCLAVIGMSVGERFIPIIGECSTMNIVCFLCYGHFQVKQENKFLLSRCFFLRVPTSSAPL